jgi:hypothetical protein
LRNEVVRLEDQIMPDIIARGGSYRRPPVPLFQLRKSRDGSGCNYNK